MISVESTKINWHATLRAVRAAHTHPSCAPAPMSFANRSSDARREKNKNKTKLVWEKLKTGPRGHLTRALSSGQKSFSGHRSFDCVPCALRWWMMTGSVVLAAPRATGRREIHYTRLLFEDNTTLLWNHARPLPFSPPHPQMIQYSSCCCVLQRCRAGWSSSCYRSFGRRIIALDHTAEERETSMIRSARRFLNAYR
jgi:hypothetical protein